MCGRGVPVGCKSGHMKPLMRSIAVTREAMCRQRAGCNAGTLTARNLVPPVECFRGCRRFKRLKAGKRQARMP